jgi:ABC-2 type transport system permease protein
VSARPGSALWLLRHEIRLFWFNMGPAASKGGARRHPGKLSIGVWLATWLVLHGVAFALLGRLDGASAMPPQLLRVATTGVLAASMTLMLSSGLKASVEVLFERADLDLLLSSPLPSISIFAVRLAGMVLGTAALYLFFLAPVAHVGLLLGQPQWLAIYPTIIGAAAIAASTAMLMTLGLVRTLGARRTRVVAQVLGALAGAFLFLVSQAFSVLSGGRDTDAATWLFQLLAPGAVLGPDSLAWLPGRAALGDPWPLLGLALLAACVVLLTVRITHGFFVHGLQQAASTARAAARAGAPRYRFGRSLMEVVIIKEWRLIVRDPHLISQVLLQLLYLLPACIPMFSAAGLSLAGIGAALTLLCGSLTASLAWIIISAEDAPDLLLASPASDRTIRYAKLAAAAMPALAIVALPLLWLLVRDPVAALLICFTVAASVLSSDLIVMWCGRRAVRGEFQARGKGNFLSGLFEMLSALAWGGLAFVLLTLRGAGDQSPMMLLAGAMALAAGLAVPGTAWLMRRRVA